MELKTIEETWEALKVMARDMPILHRCFELQRIGGFNREYTAVTMAFCLADVLKETQEQLIDAEKRACPRPLFKRRQSR